MEVKGDYVVSSWLIEVDWPGLLGWLALIGVPIVLLIGWRLWRGKK